MNHAHMCRDDHVEIGHNDSESEQCPLCRVCNALIEIIQESGPEPKLPYALRVNEIARAALRNVKAEERLYEAGLD